MSFDATHVLERLKPFQRATVEHVFERLFGVDDPTDRFLVADEVGLGKTMIARGVVAKMLERYATEEPGRRLDVVYVCSNRAIAQQNYSKIAIVGSHRAAVTDRVTKLPLHVHDLEQRLPGLGMAVNFVPLTPTTSLDLASSRGRVDERALLHVLLTDERLCGRRYMRRTGPRRLLQHGVLDSTWKSELDALRSATLNSGLVDRFVQAALVADPEDGRTAVESFQEACEVFRRRSAWHDASKTSWRTGVISRLRRLLAKSCIHALEPDLIILDEFQRFPKVLDPSSSVGELAELLFTCEDARTLLLSATPYRMLTRASELDEDHHEDFLKTTRFLLGHDEERSEELTTALRRYREALRGLRGGGWSEAHASRDAVAAELGNVMCRTERLAATPDRSGMLTTRPAEPIEPRLEPSDLFAFREIDAIADRLGTRDVLEFWKSTPYALNFMEGYKLAEEVERAAQLGRLPSLNHGLDPAAIEAHRKIDLGNARLRGLVDRLDAERAWQLLWLPPALDYYTAGRPFDRSDLRTKRLVFSAWTVVPKAIAAMVSFEAERHLFGKEGRPTTQPLGWRADGPMTEAVLALPSRALADLADPLALAAQIHGPTRPADRQAILRAASRTVRNALADLPSGPRRGPADGRWYAVAPLLLDEAASPGSVAAWLSSASLESDEQSIWRRHRRRLLEIVEQPDQLGRRPPDLEPVLTRLAIAGPGVVALRALRRNWPDAELDVLLGHAFRIGLAFRALFNLPEAVAAVQALSATRSADDVLWKAALDYCVNGNLQAVLDEYLHVLSDWVEDREAERGGKPAAVTSTAVEAIGVRTADLMARTFRSDGSIGQRLTMRSRFALRLGDGRSEDDQSVQRTDTVRKAFNSPFWPFVLATTSIGQEGLDFHLYSHAVVHWNLPSNPVDLEQREGRVHRFKCHAVRRNLAAQHRPAAFAGGDPWQHMFSAAPEEEDGLRPIWVFPGDAAIERHALALPMSRDDERLAELVRLLGIYRLAFGQPRQDELLAVLHDVPGLGSRLDELLIDLRPGGHNGGPTASRR